MPEFSSVRHAHEEKPAALQTCAQRTLPRSKAVKLSGAEAAIDQMSELILTEAAAYHQARREERPEDFGQDVMTRLKRGAAVTGVQSALAREAQRHWQRQIEQVFVRYDLLLAPTCEIPAPLIEESEGVETTRLLTRFTYPLNLALVPVLSIPLL